MSNLPEIPMDTYVARWQSKAVSLQDELFKTESLAEALLAERDAERERADNAEAELASYKNDVTEDASA